MSDLNLQAGQELSRVTNIFVEWRLRGQDLTMKDFLKEFNSKLNRGNFCDYFQAKLDERHRTEGISELRHKAQLATLRKVLEFCPELPFANMKAVDFAKKFDLWLEKKKKCNPNTRWARHKDVKTYLHLAERDNIRFEWPYEDFKVRKVAGQWTAALPREIELLDTYYHTLEPGTARRRYRRWLFGVATGLRLSDQQRAKRDWLLDDLLVFLIHKGRQGKLVKLPLGKWAMSLVQDAMREHDGENGNIFIKATGQKSNEAMEEIRQELGIKSRLHNHVGRESFATLYLENGGSLEVLKEYLDHSFIETTMKYVHVADARKRRDLNIVDAIFERPPTVSASKEVN